MQRTFWKWIWAAAILIVPAVQSQDPVDQQVSPAVKQLQAEGAKEDAASMKDPAVSPEVKSLNAAGAKQDAASWHNLASFIQSKVKSGVRGRELADEVREERQRLGLTGLDGDMIKQVMEYEKNQEQIERLEAKITALRAGLGEGNVNDSNMRRVLQQKLEKHETNKKALEKRSAEILANMDSPAKF